MFFFHNLIYPFVTCNLGKLHQLPFADCDIQSTKPLELIYSDLWGPSPILSTKVFRYYIVFVDAYTRYSWLYPLKLKFDALFVFVIFHKFVELQYNSKLRALQTDKGVEFKAFLPYLQSHGI